MARSAKGWCDLSISRCWCSSSPGVRTTPAAVCGRGFPSLSLEGNFSVEFRDRNWARNSGAQIQPVLICPYTFFNTSSLASSSAIAPRVNIMTPVAAPAVPYRSAFSNSSALTLFPSGSLQA